MLAAQTYPNREDPRSQLSPGRTDAETADDDRDLGKILAGGVDLHRLCECRGRPRAVFRDARDLAVPRRLQKFRIDRDSLCASLRGPSREAL